jgi:hypothetical protein
MSAKAAQDEKKGMSQAGFCGKSVLHRVAHEQQLDSNWIVLN